MAFGDGQGRGRAPMASYFLPSLTSLQQTHQSTSSLVLHKRRFAIKQAFFRTRRFGGMQLYLFAVMTVKRQTRNHSNATLPWTPSRDEISIFCFDIRYMNINIRRWYDFILIVINFFLFLIVILLAIFVPIYYPIPSSWVWAISMDGIKVKSEVIKHW